MVKLWNWIKTLFSKKEDDTTIINQQPERVLPSSYVGRWQPSATSTQRNQPSQRVVQDDDSSSIISTIIAAEVISEIFSSDQSDTVDFTSSSSDNSNSDMDFGGGSGGGGGAGGDW
jgi:hypothetical protein